ncbi:unnamed protein product [Darwinula stevensoni]|uniref:Uncharacterized protein n=1 Tax=Darwinula stevensoni TaxID=69355 RepID=A0A7R9FS95_9CRUS|nr:unnamed protein product [Darwinula stevensoni]CAG0903073.1 unnamed protein product [Darwinula stevensoni]
MTNDKMCCRKYRYDPEAGMKRRSEFIDLPSLHDATKGDWEALPQGCNLAVLFLTDLVSSGSEGGAGGVNVDWTIHLPLMLHMLVLGLDHTRALVAGHCVSLLAQLLIVLGPHGDHLSVAGSALKAISSCSFSGECGGDSSHSAPPTPTPPAFQWDFTKSTENLERFLEDPHGAQKEQRQQKQEQSSKFDPHVPEGEEKEGSDSAVPVIVTTEEGRASEGRSGSNEEPPEVPSVEDVTKALIHYLFARKDGALWAYEDITARTWDIKSAGQLSCLVRCVLRVFRASLPHARLEERWAQISLHVALSCSSRHYAGRSLQVFRALGVPVTSRVLTDILSRLVETVAEQGEDMQGYVAEIMLTLETAVDSLDCDFHAIDATKDLFKSTPNLNDQEPGRRTVGPAIGQSFLVSTPSIPSHARSTSYSTSHGTRKPVLGSPTVERRGEMRNRSGTEGEKRDKTAGYVTNLSRSRSAQSLKVVADSASRDDKMSVLAQLFWIATFVLESDYEYEFLLALRLLNKVLSHFPLDRPDCREKLERIQMRMKWTAFPGLHSLVLKGLTNKDTYEPALALISKFTTLMDLTVVDPSGTVGFPINVMALLPYMIHHYEDANDLCICSAENIAQVSLEKSSKLENLATVMTLYSHRNFSKESFQWTKCVVKYLHDAYSHLSLVVITFLVEVLEKGPTLVQAPILNILHCILHYIDIHSQQPPVINGDLLRAVARFVEVCSYSTIWVDRCMS